ncbi:hypothetical protein SEPCBS119000_002523 [Sporothrix epigloea]|uniref:PSP1 C-terminal domain-containing protein n=1 Tax=Sporothrix epigloea TaxID=1892477 RepID=A0ABP0DK52_9PEZI
MSSGYKAGPSAKLGQSGTSVLSSQAILPNRFNRRSTPDSEALASSDEETDLVSPLDHLNYTAAATIDAVVGATPTASTHTSQSQQSLSQTRPESRTSNQSQPQPQTLPPKPLRRASWLNDTRQSLVRPWGESLNGASMSPTLSHPSPSAVGAGAELGSASGAPATWSAHATSPANFFNRIHSNTSATSPWGTTMWNTERKEPPSRLSEVLPSPTSAIPPGPTGGLFLGGAGSDNSLSQPPNTARDGLGTSQIPFAIPLHPTPKTYRSQSYSVGQLETDASALTDSLTSPITSSLVGPSLLNGSRSRPIPGLQHRPSRPSMLSEMSSDGGMLGKVKEVDDGDESATDSLQGSLHLSAEAKTIELLTRENAMLRQHASQQYHNRLRPRASTGTAYRLENGHALQESVSEESPDYAIDELDEINNEDASTAAAAKTLNGRRMSEFAAPGSSRPPFSAENRKIESVKRAYWQTSPAGFADISPSRRHSFADIPTRQASISSINETIPPHNTNSHDSQQPGIAEFGLSFGDAHSFSAKSLAAAQSVYGANVSGAPLGTAQIGHQEMLQQHQLALQQQQNHMGSAAVSSYGSSGSAYPSSYSLHTPMFAARPSSPQRGVYGMSQPNRSTPLHIVLFKCARADVFYIQDGTGLTVKPGDLVIVEADRGTDLGTVAVDNVDWVEGRRLKEHYSEEQYKWLMMYSQNAEDAQDGAESGLMASSFELHGGAIGGMGSAGQHHIQEPNAGELKPKLIKRLAQNHEIHALRDKEGNEAKAKRVCMQKVKEHGLKMEILDAEFQM